MTRSFLLILVLSLSASAGVIFSTDGTATPGFFPSAGSVSNSSVFHAFEFTVASGQGGALGQIVVAGGSSTAFTETVDIFSNSSGAIGSLLDSASLAIVGDSVTRLYTGTAANGATLVAGTSYWIEVASPSGSNAILWAEASPVATTNEYSSATGYFSGQPSAAFAVLTAPTAPSIPEPATWLLSLPVLASLALLRLKQKA